MSISKRRFSRWAQVNGAVGGAERGLAVAVLGVILSAGYFLWYYQRAFFGPPSGNVSKLSDLMPREFAMAAVMIALLFWVGVYPGPFLKITGGSVDALIEHVERRTGTTIQARAAELRSSAKLVVGDTR